MQYNQNAPPAWSMGKSNRGSESRHDRDYKQVGPGSYVSSMVDKKAEPKYSIKGKYASENKTLEVPGAGSYESPSKLIESPGKSIGQKLPNRSLAGVLGPGPGGYAVDKQKRNDLKYSMGGKLRDLEFEKATGFKPGPGNYSPAKTQSIPSMKFGTGSRIELGGGKEQKAKPGPGTYIGDARATQSAAPKYGFGSSNRDPSLTRLNVPGPGSYVAPNMIGKEGPSQTMGAITEYTPHKKEQAFKPGPGQYNPDVTGSKKKEPAYKMGTAHRQDLATEKQHAYQTSPGQYEPLLNGTKQKSAQWRFGSEHRPGMVTKGHDAQPGPNQYNIPSRVGEGAKVHMHARTDSVDMNKKMNIPGPGQYNLQDTGNANMPKAAAFSMGSGSRIDLGGGKEALAKPGPGNYAHDADLKKSAPKYGFGSSARPEVVQKGRTPNPAPGSYEIRGLMGQDGPSKSLSPKLIDKYAEKQQRLQPGPGTYDSSTNMMKASPNYGMGTEGRAGPVNLKNATPDPGAYNPSVDYSKQKAPGYKIGSEIRDPFDTKRHKGQPGPGNYQPGGGAFKNKPQFYMGIKLQDSTKMNVPGSGTYDPNASPQQKAAPGYSMGIKLKSELDKNLSNRNPGPGNYDGSGEKLKQSAPQFGFGSSKRADLKTTGTPGPGHYYIPVKVADVPDYNMPGRPNPEFKVV